MATVPADCVFGQDNVNVSALTPGFPVYGGYFNGPFANVSALKRRFPHAYIVSIATRLNASKGAVSVDIEPGTVGSTQAACFSACLSWLNQGGFGGPKPLVYVMASWAAPLESYLAARGWPRSRYWMWTAHYAGVHLCSRTTCGYGGSKQADATQYATGANDHDVFRGYVTGGTPPPVNNGGYPTLGSTGDKVKVVQTLLNKWAAACGFGKLVVDGDFGGKTYAAAMAFQRHARITADGIVGPVTMRELLKTPPKPAVPPPAPKPVVPSGNPLLRSGSHGQQVAAMQYYLSHSGLRGVRGISADGDFGPQTLTAVRNFQAHMLLSIDGVYGPATARRLARYAVA